MGHHEMIMLQRKFNKSPLGCLFRCGKKWLKIFMPVIVVLGIGMAVMMTSEIDPQITGKFFSKKKSFFFRDLSVFDNIIVTVVLLYFVSFFNRLFPRNNLSNRFKQVFNIFFVVLIF